MGRMAVQETPRAVSVEVPAGEFFLGDPCYAIPQGLWALLLNGNGCFSTSPVGRVNDHDVLGFSTAWGDGTYRDQFGVEYCVDSGLIGLTPVGLGDQDRDWLRKLGRFIEFSVPVVATTDGRGLLNFGSIRIDTRDDGDAW